MKHINITTILLVALFIVAIEASAILLIYGSVWCIATFFVSVCIWGVLQSSTTKE